MPYSKISVLSRCSLVILKVKFLVCIYHNLHVFYLFVYLFIYSFLREGLSV